MTDVSAQMKFEEGFTVTNPQIVMDIDPKNRVIACESTFKGRQYFRIMQIWKYGDEETWRPGKGFGVPVNKKAELLDALKRLT